MGSQMSTRHQFSGAIGSGIPGMNTSGTGDYRSSSHHAAAFDEFTDDRFVTNGEEQDHSAMKRGGLHVATACPRQVEKPGGLEARHDMEQDSDLVTCVFTWTHGGEEVLLTGSFNDWATDKRIVLAKAGHEFVTIQELPRGRHLYKFIVDNVWKYATDQPTVTDDNGFVNNIIDTRDHKRFRYQIVSELDQARAANFHQYIPNASEYTTDAPQIPLMFTKTSSPASFPPTRTAAPLHSIANHVYYDSNAPNIFGPHISVVATTHRWLGADRCIHATQKYSTVTMVTLNPLFLVAAPTKVEGYQPPNPLRGLITKHFLSPEGLAATPVSGNSETNFRTDYSS